MILKLVAFVVFIPGFCWAQQASRSNLKIEVAKPLRVDYLAPSWNKDPAVAEAGVFLIRDADTGQLARVEVTESGPNTGLFVGLYQLRFAEGVRAVTPEVYVPPQSLMDSSSAMERLEPLIKNGTLLRSPYFLRIENGVQTLTVFDSRAQAMEAYQLYLKNGIGQKPLELRAIDDSGLSSKTSEDRARLDVEKKAVQDRAALLAQEKAKQDLLMKEQAAVSEGERQIRRDRSKALASQALDLYKKEQYSEAETRFDQARELDPENNETMGQYGITLYKTSKFDKAIVTLSLAQGAGVNVNERDYYLGLAYLKKKEYEKATNLFSQLKTRQDPNLSPPAAFFSGVIEFQKETFAAAKTDFQYVLDTSKDPQMDSQAESYIEQIANIQRFQEMQKKKFILAANFGLMSDSNILSIPAANAPTDLDGYRWFYSGSIEYRPIFTQKNELSALISFSDMYSVDRNFRSSATFENTDPLIIDFSVPYRWKGDLWKKNVQLSFWPGYEAIHMNADGVGGRETIVESSILHFDGTLAPSESTLSNYALEVRHDNSFIDTTADESQTANKVTLSSSQTFFTDAKKTTAWIGDFALARNAAKGQNQTYNRADFGFSRLQPVGWSVNLMGRLGLGLAKYPDHETGRSDTMTTATLLAQKQLKETVGVNLGVAYTKNDSTDAAYAYDKFVVTAGMNWQGMF